MNKANNSYLAVENISKYFGRRKVLQDITFSLKKGEFLTIFGPNGVGKTTLIKVLATILNPTKGDFSLKGISEKRDPVFIRKNIGVISHNPYLYPDLTAYENLRFFCRLFGVNNSEERITGLLELVDLSERRFDLIRTFSRGMQQRIAIARAMLHKPQLLFLDEPHSGLDAQAVTILDQAIENLKETNSTFIMTTHSLEKGLVLADRALILSTKGIVFDERTKGIDIKSFKDRYLAKVKEN